MIKENKAEGRVGAPYLFTMLSKPTPGMEAWFWKKLLAAGILKSDVRIVYMLDEPPAGSGNKPLKSQVRSAANRFAREVKKSKPKVVVPMGAECFHALTGIMEPIFDARGYLIRSPMFKQVPVDVYKQVGVYKNASKATGAKKGDPKMKYVTEAQDALLGSKFKGVVIPVFGLDHIRTEKFAVSPTFKEDILRARRVVKGELQEIDENFTFIDGANLSQKKRLALVKEEWGDVIAVDIETHGIDNEVIDLVSFSDRDRTVVLDWAEDARLIMQRIFALPGKLFAIHNSNFDVPRLRANGVLIAQEVIDRQVVDTMYGAVTVQPDLHKALGRVASLYLDMSPWKTSSKNENSPWRVMVRENPRLYAAKDALATAYIAHELIKIMKGAGTWKLFMGIEGHPGPGIMETLPELDLMTRGGIRTSRDRAITWCSKLEKQLFRYNRIWARMFPTISATSNQQLGKLLYGTWGLPVTRTTEDGVSVDELTLVVLRSFVEAQRGNEDDHPGPWHEDARACARTFDLLLRIRDTSKNLNTYVQPIMMGQETWVHPQYMPISKDDEKGSRGGRKMDSKGNTATGRLAAYKPNIQNQPKDVRVLYVPDYDEWCFVQADYKSAELYVLAGMAGDKRLLDDLTYDLHQRNADRLGVPRPTAKNVMYASVYLASHNKQSEMILEQNHVWVSPADCLSISEGIWGYYTDSTAYKQTLVAMCEAKKYITNPFGRVRYFHDGRAPAAVDFIPQSTVADILWCVLKKVATLARKFGGRLVTTVHDSILCCVPAAVRDQFAVEMKAVMEQRFDCVRKGFYIPVELELGAPGASWGDLKKWEPMKEAA